MAQATTTANRPKNKVRVEVTRAQVVDIKIVDTDLVLTLDDGRKLYVSDGAIQSMMDQEFAVEFADGTSVGGQELLQSAGAADIGRVAVTSAAGEGAAPVVAQAPAPQGGEQAPAAQPAKSGGLKSWLAIGTPVLGGLLGGVLGGGGGGAAAGAIGNTDNGNTAVKTNTPVIAVVTSDDRISGAEKAAGVVVAGTAEANATVTVTWGATTKTVTANASGAWTTTFAAAEVPADAPLTTLTATAKTATGLTSDFATKTIQIDATAPNAPVISAIAGDNVVGPNEKGNGVVVTGTAEPNSAVTVTWGTTVKTAISDLVGNWAVTFATGEVPEAGSYTVTATATDTLGNVSGVGNRALSVTPAVTVEGVITAGPAIAGNGLSVSVYTGAGALVASNIAVSATGQFVATGLQLSPGEIFVIRVNDQSAGADYLDEATNAPKDLNANLFAVAIVGGSNMVVNVNPLTTIAAIKAGLAADGSGTITSAAAVTSSRAATAQAFGLNGVDIVTETPVPSNGGQYSPTDGLSTGERLGAVLAALSGVDVANGGDTQVALSAIASGVNTTGSVGTLSETAANAIMAGAIAADLSTPGALPAVISDTLAGTAGAQVSIAPVTPDNIVSASETAGLVISGTAPAGTSAVSLLVGGATFAATVNGTDWSYALSAADLASIGGDGPKLVTATATLANASIASATRPIVVSATLPAAPTISPVATDNVVNRAEREAGVGVSGTAAPGTTVAVELSGVIKTTTPNASGLWTVNFTAAELPTSGTPTLSARVTDLFGNTSPAATMPLPIQTALPGAPTISAVAGDDLVGPVEKAGGVSVSGTGSPGGQVALVWGNVARSVSVDANGGWTTIFTPSQIPSDGDYAITAQSTDAAGNQSTTISRAVRVDATPPAPPVISSVASDNLVSQAEKLAGVTVRGTAEPNANIEVTWGAIARTIRANASGNWSTTFTSAQVPNDGATTITAVATDPSGNVSQQGSRPVTIDTSNLPPTIIAIGSGTVINATQKTAGVVVNGASEASATVTVSFGGATRTVIATSAGLWQAIFSGSDIPEASSAVVVAQSTDPAGNQSTSSTRTVAIDTVLPDTPVINVVSGDDSVGSGDFTAGVEVTGTAEPNATVQVNWENVTKTTTADSAGGWTVTFADADKPSDGVKNIIVRAVDAAGNISAAEQRPVVVDTIASIPVINTVSGNNIIGLAERNAGVSITGTSDPNATVTVTWNNIQKQTQASATGVWSVNYATGEIPITGTSQITARALDMGGNINNAVPRSVVVDTVATAPTIGNVSTDNLIGAPEIANGITVTGTAEAGSTVTVNWGSAQRVTSADANGVWSAIFDTPSVPADGVVNLTARAVDLGGNASSVATLPITIDRAAPGKPTIDAVSTDDRVSAAEKAAPGGVVVTGSAEANSTVQVQWGSVTRTVTSDATGLWTAVFASSDLSQEGAINVTATQIDRAGNPSATETRIVTVDTVAPTPPVIDPVTGNNIVNSSEKSSGVMVTGTALAGAPVSVIWGGTTLSTTADPVSGAWAVTFTTLQVPPDGVHTIRARQSDPAGNISSDRTLDVTVETAPATTATIAVVSGNDIINAAERAAGLTISGSAPANAQVTVNWNGVTRNVTAASDGSWSAIFNPSEIPASGVSTITATATTFAGNVGLPGTRTVTVDQTPPAAPTINSVTADDRVNSTEKTAGVTVSGSGEPGGKVVLIWGTVTTPEIEIDTNGNWTTIFPNTQVPSDGLTTLRAYAIDAAGNIGPETSRNVTVDTVAPAAPIISLVSGDDRINAAEKSAGVTISGSAEANATVTLTWGSTTRSAVVNGTGNWSMTLNSSEIPNDGVAPTLSVSQRDVAGNVGAARTRTVTVDTQGPNPPVIATVSAGTVVNAAERDLGVTITGTTDAASTVSVTWGGTTRAATVTGTSWTVTFPNTSIPADGSTSITAIATDVAGNPSAASTPTNVVVDTTAPGAPVIAIVSGDNRISSVEKSDGVNVSGTAEANATVSVTLGTVTKTVTANGSGVWVANFTSVEIPSDGTTTISAVQTDAAGNAGVLIGTRDVTVDTAPPPPPVIAGMSNNYGSNPFSTDRSTVRVAGTGEVGSTITVFVEGVAAGTAIVDAKGVWISSALTLPNTSVTVTARQTDAAGNVGTTTAGQTISNVTVSGTIVSLGGILPSFGYLVWGDYNDDRLGPVDSGDFDGDGYIDLLVGAPLGDDKGSNAGEGYVIFGKDGGPAKLLGNSGGRLVVDLTTLAAADGFVIQADAANDGLGDSLSALGDINGDGVADMVIGARQGDDGGSNAGEAYVIFGKSGGNWATTTSGTRAVLSLTTLSPADGFVIQGDVAGDAAGFSVSDAGDVNGDGIADLIISARNGDDGGTDAGEAYVIFGKPAGQSFGAVDPLGTGRRVLDLTSLAPTDGFIIQGDTLGDNAGHSVSSGGDLNGDGVGDLLVSAWLGDDAAASAGETYVIFGKSGGSPFGVPDAGGRRVLDLSFMAPLDGFVIRGVAASDQSGTSVSSAGDVNGDGIGDYLIGAWQSDPNGAADAGAAYLIYGKVGTPPGQIDAVTGRRVLDLATLTPDQGFVINGATAGDNLGVAVSAAGDVNGDGLADFLVGAWRGQVNPSNPTSDEGLTYLIFGKAGGGWLTTTDGAGRQVLNVAALAPADGLTLSGQAAGDTSGQFISAAGDLNRDGIADFLIGAPQSDPQNASAAGTVYAVYGRADWGGLTRNATASSDFLIGGDMSDVFTDVSAGDTALGLAGNDTISVLGGTFYRVDGGAGTDTLSLFGGGISLDLTTLASNTISGIEIIDINGSGSNTLTITRDTLLALSDTTDTLIVNMGAGDTLNAAGFGTTGATQTINGTSYTVYTNGAATLLVQPGGTVTTPPEAIGALNLPLDPNGYGQMVI